MALRRAGDEGSPLIGIEKESRIFGGMVEKIVESLRSLAG